jgi:DNA mismatch endonuclease (patch repair protein)
LNEAENLVVKGRSRWTIEEDAQAKGLLEKGHSCKEVSLITGRSLFSISKRNSRVWGLSLKSINYSEKLSRSLHRISDKLSGRMKGKWSGKNNPNYGAKIVKTGKENPFSIWKAQNPGYQDGDKNPSFGKIYSPESIEKKTRKIRESNLFLKGKTYKEVYGKERAEEIGRLMSLSAVKRIAKQKKSGTRPEKVIKEFLDILGIQYEFQYPIQYYCVDFFIPSMNLIIQTDECYWHACPEHFSGELSFIQKKNRRTDQSCNTYLKNRGYNLIRIWECKLPEDANGLDRILNKIKELTL